MKVLRLVLSRAAGALLVIAALQVMSIPTACAADPHHEAAVEHANEGDHHAPGIDQLLFPAINFTIYLFIVVRFVIPAMSEYLRRRHSDLVESQAESNAALTRAQQELMASKVRLAGLKEEAEAIRRDLLTIATRQADRLKAQAEETGARRLADAALLAEQERRRAMAALRSQVADAASRIAEEKVRAALTSDDQRSFVQQFLKEASTR